jgi:tRNA modification GTPase
MHRSAKGNSLETSTDLTAGNKSMIAGETMAAISTPAGEGAIALIRVSGVDAITIADEIFRGKEKPSRFASHVRISEKSWLKRSLIDRVVLSIIARPHYRAKIWSRSVATGWALVAAGSGSVSAWVRERRPGSRALLSQWKNGPDAGEAGCRFDPRQDRSGASFCHGAARRRRRENQEIRDDFNFPRRYIDASIDFPEEGMRRMKEKRWARDSTLLREIAALLATADQGRILREGVRVVIYGATNAGKSSLLNRLLGYDRVIVSQTHGTTRDTIEETVNLDGVPIRLLDTAGLRASASELEREGIARTEKSLQLADLRLHIADRNAPKPSHFNERAGEANEIVVLNKSDLPENSDWKISGRRGFPA